MPSNYSERKKWIEKRCSFWVTFLSPLHCSHPETRNWICRETVTGIRYTWGRARLMATFARYSRILLSLTWDLTRTGKVFLYQESRPPHDTPPRVLFTDNDDDDDTLDTLRWDFQKFKNLACFAMLRLNSASRILFFRDDASNFSRGFNLD